jgi:hypothetical protein
MSSVTATHEQGNDYAIVLIDADAGISIGLHHHDAVDGRPFEERQTGLDHINDIQSEFFHLST